MDKNYKHDPRRLHDEWEHAVERAAEVQARDAELQQVTLNDAAGLTVQSGVRAGHTWSASCNQSGCCNWG